MNWSFMVVAMMPEHLLLMGIAVLIALDVLDVGQRYSALVAMSAVLGATLMAVLLAIVQFQGSPFPGHFSVDQATLTAKAVVLALTLPLLQLSRDEFGDDERFYILLLSSLYGVLLVTSADGFLTMFLGLEIMSMPVYVLVLLAYKRHEAAEAALKYLVLGGAATAMFLMGASLVYGATGSLALDAFVKAAQARDTLAVVAVILVLVAFFLKAAVVPFHTWAPDAYEAASVPATAFMAIVIKAGVLLAVVRLVGMAKLGSPLVDLIAILPLVSMVWGNLAAMRQTSFRRMIAYSSIAHAGYLFYALLGDGPTRLQAVIFYLLAYGLMNALAFASLPAGPDDARRDRLDALKGLYHRQPYAAILLGIALLSLAGIPPFPGFVAKFLIFKNVIAAGYTLYAVLGLVGSYLGIYFYLRVIQLMFMGSQPEGPPATGRIAVAAGVLCLVPTVALTVFPGVFITLLGR
ncbi:MAG TPA: NADH-quinone oxidoreductase subunit N [Burkholderiaceae bacterium]|nr:NADH-quinone oxidoreductase subunit N [Burkholderiaceae bacterium]